MAGERNWVHRSKHVPWGGGTGAGEIYKLGADWSGAAFVWAFSTTKNGSPAFTLNAAAAYEVQLWGERSSASPTKTISFGGTISATGS